MEIELALGTLQAAQIFDHAGQQADLGQQLLQISWLERSHTVLHRLDFTAHHRQRRAQVMRDVSDDALAPRLLALQAFSQAIERFRDGLQLVPRVWHAQFHARFTALQTPRRLLEREEWPRQTPRDDGGRQARQQKRADPCENRGARNVPERLTSGAVARVVNADHKALTLEGTRGQLKPDNLGKAASQLEFRPVDGRIRQPRRQSHRPERDD